MQNDVRISVIVPVYNTEKYLTECINSILNQTISDWELILIDDGSTDNSYSICQKYAKKDCRVRVFHQENQGQGAARNLGLQYCWGKYVTFVDSDDFVHDEMLDNLLCVMEENHADVVSAQIECFTDKITDLVKDDDIKILSVYQEGAFESFVMEHNWQNHVIVAKLYRRGILSEVEFPQFRAIEDEFFLSKIFAKAQRIVKLHNVRYYYRQTPNSTMRGSFKAERALIIQALSDRAMICRDMNRIDLEMVVDGQCLLECMDWWTKFRENNLYEKQTEVLETFRAKYSSGMKSCGLTRKDRFRIRLFYFCPLLYANLLRLFRK